MQKVNLCPADYISIRAPAWGATHSEYVITIDLKNFNPRSRVGSDLNDIFGYSLFDISIRAPAWGATSNGQWSGASAGYFNPRSHEGSDLLLTCRPTKMTHFNPRSHEGSDAQCIPCKTMQNSFQSALPRGERHRFTCYVPQAKDFNPRSHEGSDFCALWDAASCKISIRAPTRGATGMGLGICKRQRIFQSALPRGERLSLS